MTTTPEEARAAEEPIVPPYPEHIARHHYASGLWSETLLVEQIANWAKARPTQVAIVDGDDRINYAELVRLTTDAARWLQSLGVRRGDVVAVQLPNCAHLVITVLALLRLGAIYMPLNAAYRESDVSRILDVAPPRLYLYPRRFGTTDYAALVESIGERTEHLKNPIALDLDAPFDPPLPVGDGDAPLPTAEADDLFLLGSTSGSTGEPKLYAHSQNTQFGEARMMNEVLNLTSDDVFLVMAPMTHRGALMYGLLMALTAGGTLVVARQYKTNEVVRLIDEESVTTFFAIPTSVFEILGAASAKGIACTSLRRLMLAGAPVQPELVALIQEHWPNCIPVTGYGASESGFATATRPDDPLEVLQTCGRPLPGQQIAIDGDAAQGDEGEILARGTFLFRGYVSEQQTRNSLTDGWLRTGDLGRIDSDGNLHVTGRLKNVIIRAGMKIRAEEVETILLTHPSVAEALVIGMHHERLGEQAVACVVPKPGMTLGPDEIAPLFEDSGISKFKWPELLACVSALPKNAVGKQDRGATRAALSSYQLVALR